MNKKIIALIVALLLTGAAAGGYAWVAQSNADNAEPVVEPELPPKFYRIEKIVLSLPSDRYLLLEFSLKVSEYDDDTEKQIDSYAPVIRNATIGVMGQKPLDQLIDSSFLVAHQDELELAFEQQLAANGFALIIDQVLVTKLVVQ
ncbi:flagellar basal body-associated FliL family protein [uncultured Ferrimonas sp.]|uniref:flagellar basal body-associated FliL family protein n=1 Tax=uncultured Ferrimonas sp. TaxID=432640 RepID=UPI002628449F|nr:flagellar basal body-associated FliL family protein [uncultured Ferrimonas sp.]